MRLRWTQEPSAVELSDDGLQMNGQIGPAKAFFIVSSSEPDDVTVEPTSRFRTEP